MYVFFLSWLLRQLGIPLSSSVVTGVVAVCILQFCRRPLLAPVVMRVMRLPDPQILWSIVLCTAML